MGRCVLPKNGYSGSGEVIMVLDHIGVDFSWGVGGEWGGLLS